MYNRPLFDHNNTKEEKIVGTVGLLIIYGFLIYLAICQIIKTNEIKQVAEHLCNNTCEVGEEK